MSLAIFTFTPRHPVGYRLRRPSRTYSFAGSQSEQRVSLASRTLRVYRWPFRVSAASGTREALDAFFVARGGSGESFLVKDLKDYARTGVVLEPPTSDDVETVFSLPTSGELAGDYPIDDANAILYRAGVAAAKTVQTDARTLTAAVAPLTGGAMTADYWYRRRVKFAEDLEWSEPVFGTFECEVVLEEVEPS